MTDIKINTYTNGFDFVLCNQLTKDGMVELCQLLDMRFGDGNVFVPEGISDGFILWVDWPGNPPTKWRTNAFASTAKTAMKADGLGW